MYPFTIKAPVHVQLLLTYRCNWNCVFCDLKQQNSKLYPYSHFNRILEKLKEAEVFEITLYGGEPFLHPNFFDIAKKAWSLDFDLNFVSNGSLIDNSNIHLITEYFKSGAVSIHGFETSHDKLVGKKGAFKRVINSLELLTKNDFPTGVCITITSINYKEIPNLIRYLLKNYNIYYIALDIFKPFNGKNLDLLPDYIELSNILNCISEIQKYHPEVYIDLGGCIPFCLFSEINIQKKSCWAGVLSCAVTPDGDVKICSESDIRLGNILNESLEYIWTNSDILKDYRSFKWLPSYCRSCPLLHKCLGGCKVTRKKMFSSDILMEIWKDYLKIPLNHKHRKTKKKFSYDGNLMDSNTVVVIKDNVKWRDDISGLLVKNIYGEYYMLPSEFKKFFESLKKRKNINELSTLLACNNEQIEYIIQLLRNLYILDVINKY